MSFLKLTRFNSSFVANITKMRIESMTKIIDCKENHAISKASSLLSNEEVIAVPTDTIYGLACSANCPEAIKKLYKIKGRDAAKPVAICVSNISDVRKWGKADHLHDNLLHSILPGPVTLVLKKTKNLDNPYLNPHTQKIGIRIPKHDFMNKLTWMLDKPVALTSANFSNEPSSLRIEEFEKLYNQLGAIFNGGVLSNGLEVNRSGSTVIDLSESGVFKIIRQGISHEKIVDILEKNGISRI